MYPKEVYLKLSNDDVREVRLSVSKYEQKFNLEIDIVFIESKKIWQHLGTSHSHESEKEAISQGIQKVSDYLKI